ncbi:MAG: hypothetical protein AUJ75_04635 [Candidatus Omnitrophica bacterium CG1_02_49_10]|nr:MAG: hypothetical protein AUJ75_04635 [Candidatus Omnitrophica bacterium CG1_02_49_10]
MNNDDKGFFESEWHSSYIEFNRLLGSLEAKRQQLAGINRLNALFRLSMLSFVLKIVIFAGLAFAVYYLVITYDLAPLIKDGFEKIVGKLRETGRGI